MIVNEEGALKVETPIGGFEDGRPEACQEDEEEERVAVAIEYDLFEGEEGHYTYGFRVGEYDRSRVLILDPAVLIYCGYIDGSGYEYGLGISVDGSDNAYVTGVTSSSEAAFPVIVGSATTHNGGWDVFVAKIHHYTAKNDFNIDGQENLLWRHYTAGANSVWYMIGTTITGTETLTAVGDLNWKIESH